MTALALQTLMMMKLLTPVVELLRKQLPLLHYSRADDLTVSKSFFFTLKKELTLFPDTVRTNSSTTSSDSLPEPPALASFFFMNDIPFDSSKIGYAYTNSR